MTTANDAITVTAGAGTTIATHLAAAKEHQVIVVADDAGHLLGTLDAYVASYRLATEVAVAALSFAFAANTEKQWATIYHTAAATKTVRVRRVELYLAATAATILNVELRRLTATTAPATGAPVITPIAVNPASAAAEATCLALPTTAGSTIANQAFFTQELNLGANTAQTTSFPADPITLWPYEGGDDNVMPDLRMRAGVAEGYAVSLRSSAIATIKGTIRIVFTEQT